MSYVCRVPSCIEEAKVIGLCKKCYSYMYNWNKRDHDEMEHRQENLALYSMRLQMLGASKPNNSVKIHAKNKLKVLPGEARESTVHSAKGKRSATG